MDTTTLWTQYHSKLQQLKQQYAKKIVTSVMNKLNIPFDNQFDYTINNNIVIAKNTQTQIAIHIADSILVHVWHNGIGKEYTV